MPSSLTRVLPSVSGFSPRPPASVSGTGTHTLLSSFSRQRELGRFPTSFRSCQHSAFAGSVLHCFPASCRLRGCPSPRSSYPSVSLLRQTSISGAGISTCCPSPTTSVLGLGPDLPWVDEPSPGNLGPSTPMFLTWVSLLIPAFSLL